MGFQVVFESENVFAQSNCQQIGSFVTGLGSAVSSPSGVRGAALAQSHLGIF